MTVDYWPLTEQSGTLATNKAAPVGQAGIVNRVVNPSFEDAPDYIVLPGLSNNFAIAPDTPGLSIVGDLDVRAKIAAADWTPSASQVPLNKSGSWAITLQSSGNLRLDWNEGVNARQATSTVALSLADGSIKIVRATLDVDNGSGGRTVRFYTSDDYNPTTDLGTWTQLGSDVVQPGATFINDSTGSVFCGGSTGSYVGRFYWGQIRNGINGPIVASPDLGVGAGEFVDTQGNVWSIGGGAWQYGYWNLGADGLVSSAVAFHGSRSIELKRRVATGARNYLHSASPNGPTLIGAAPGSILAVSFYTYCLGNGFSTGPTFRVWARTGTTRVSRLATTGAWGNDDTLGRVLLPQTPVGQWVRTVKITQAVPSGIDNLEIELFSDGTQPVATWGYIDAIQIEEKSSASSFVVGRQAGHGTYSSRVSQTDSPIELVPGSLVSGTMAASGSPNPNDEMTVNFWHKGVQDNDVDQFFPVIRKLTFLTGGVGRGWFIDKRNLGASGTIGVRIDTSAATNQVKLIPRSAQFNVFDNLWHMLTLVLNRGNWKWYMDGVLASSGTYQHGLGFGDIGGNIADIQAQAYDTTVRKHRVCHLNVVDRELTAAELLAVYANRNKVFTQIPRGLAVLESDSIELYSDIAGLEGSVEI